LIEINPTGPTTSNVTLDDTLYLRSLKIFGDKEFCYWLILIAPSGVILSEAAFQAERRIWREVTRQSTPDPSPPLVQARGVGMTH